MTLKNPRRFTPACNNICFKRCYTIIMYEFETKLLAHENVFLNGLIYIQWTQFTVCSSRNLAMTKKYFKHHNAGTAWIYWQLMPLPFVWIYECCAVKCHICLLFCSGLFGRNASTTNEDVTKDSASKHQWRMKPAVKLLLLLCGCNLSKEAFWQIVIKCYVWATKFGLQCRAF